MDSLKYINRELEKELFSALAQFPAVAVTGPRQSGKSTLLRFSLPEYAYITLDDPVVRGQAIDDPNLFLDSISEPVIIDEFQYAPDLLHYIKMRIDSDRGVKGRFILTGSQQFIATKGLSESLAGRIGLLELVPFSLLESQSAGGSQDSCEVFAELTLRGSFPELVVDKSMDASRWYAAYLQTYIERDIRTLYDIGNLRDFEHVLRLLAARCSQQLNLSTLSRDVGVSVNTIKRWVSILEACRIIYLLPAYYRNLGQRVVKAPKVYFIDSGLVCYLTGLRDEHHLMAGPMAGALFENFCIQEALKASLVRGARPRLSYLRTKSGFEIDLVVESDKGALYPFEFKISKTPKPVMADALEHFIEKLEPDKAMDGALVSLSADEWLLKRRVTAISIFKFAENLRGFYEI